MYEQSSIQHATIYIYILCGLRKGLLVVVFAWRVLRHIHQYTKIHRHFHWQREEKYRHTHTHSWHIHMSRCILIDYYYVVLYRTSFTSINTSYNIIIWLCILLLYLMKCHCHFSCIHALNAGHGFVSIMTVELFQRESKVPKFIIVIAKKNYCIFYFSFFFYYYIRMKKKKKSWNNPNLPIKNP